MYMIFVQGHGWSQSISVPSISVLKKHTDRILKSAYDKLEITKIK